MYLLTKKLAQTCALLVVSIFALAFGSACQLDTSIEDSVGQAENLYDKMMFTIYDVPDLTTMIDNDPDGNFSITVDNPNVNVEPDEFHVPSWREYRNSTKPIELLSEETNIPRNHHVPIFLAIDVVIDSEFPIDRPLDLRIQGRKYKCEQSYNVDWYKNYNAYVDQCEYKRDSDSGQTKFLQFRAYKMSVDFDENGLRKIPGLPIDDKDIDYIRKGDYINEKLNVPVDSFTKDKKEHARHSALRMESEVNGDSFYRILMPITEFKKLGIYWWSRGGGHIHQEFSLEFIFSEPIN